MKLIDADVLLNKIDDAIQCESVGETDTSVIQKEKYIALGLKIAYNEIKKLPTIELDTNFCDTPSNELDCRKENDNKYIFVSKLRKGDIFIHNKYPYVLVDYDKQNEVAFITTLENYVFVEIQNSGVYGYTNGSFEKLKETEIVEYIGSFHEWNRNGISVNVNKDENKICNSKIVSKWFLADDGYLRCYNCKHKAFYDGDECVATNFCSNCGCYMYSLRTIDDNNLNPN